MQNQSTYQNEGHLNEFLNGLKITLVISMAFFLASIVGKDPASWPITFKVSLGYGISIYGFIWLAYAAVESYIDWRNDNGDTDFSIWVLLVASPHQLLAYQLER